MFCPEYLSFEPIYFEPHNTFRKFYKSLRLSAFQKTSPTSMVNFVISHISDVEVNFFC